LFFIIIILFAFFYFLFVSLALLLEHTQQLARFISLLMSLDSLIASDAFRRSTNCLGFFLILFFFYSEQPVTTEDRNWNSKWYSFHFFILVSTVSLLARRFLYYNLLCANLRVFICSSPNAPRYSCVYWPLRKRKICRVSSDAWIGEFLEEKQPRKTGTSA